MVITKDTKTIKYHGNFETFPELQEYRTRDLYSSASLGLWTYRGRADDLIVLSNGEKINPIPMENLIKSHPQVRSALMVGEYRFIPSLMVEMNDGKVPRTAEEQRGSLNEIWPTVQEANKIAPAFAKVPKSLIQFTTRGKPFLRAGKGTVQRQATVKAYSEELEKLFNTQETGLLTEGLTLGGEISSETVEAFTREVCLQAIATKGFKDLDNFANSEDLFAWGTDSLSVMVIVQRLRAVMRSYDAAYDVEIISPRMIYDATSIEKIAEAILITTSETLRAQNGVTRGEKLKRMLRKYSDDIPTQSINGRSSNKGKEAPEPWKVILSGTTGSLGSYLLASLMGQPESKIVKIFCLNRSANSDKRQEKANSFRGLKSSWGKRVEFLQSDFSQPSLGLKKEKYAELIDETTVIIHCAWKVDFNLSIESFEPQIRGVRNLLNFSFNSKQQAPLVFISSISTVLEWLSDNPESRAPAAVLHDFEAPENLGYGESKYVSERLIEEFSKTSGIQTAVFRTGQIAGPLSKKGSWNQQEWLPSTIASSKHLGILPDSLASFEVIDWIPVDVLSDIMIELVNGILQRDQGKGQTIVYNLANPEVTTWFSILPSVQKLVGITKTSSLDDWVRVLETSLQQNNGIIIEQNPAAKLLDFFRLLARRETGTMSRYEVDNLVRDSKVAAQLEAVSQDWMELWLGQWNF
jgi:thioester reductase-like protein